MGDVVELLPRAEREEVAEMRAYWLKVDNDRDAMTRIAFLAERINDIIAEVGGDISVADRLSLAWHLSLISELAQPRSDGKIKPGCVLPRFPQRSEDRACEDRDPPDGAA